MKKDISSTGGDIVVFDSPHMRAAIDVTAQFLNADAGYRDSYGRYYHNAESNNHVFTTFLNANQRTFWEKITFTYGFVFRDTSTTTSADPGRILLSKPTSTDSGAKVGNQLSMDDMGTADRFAWRCFAQDNTEEVAVIDSVPKDRWIIGYVIKADGVASKIGLKPKGDASWTVATATGGPITVDYDNAKDAALIGRIHPIAGTVDSPFLGDTQKFCMWDVAITEATVQSSIEDHFGRADRPAAPMTLGGGMGAMQGLGRRKGRRH